MARRQIGSALAGLFGAGLLASHAAPAQTAPAPETPVIASLSEGFCCLDMVIPTSRGRHSNIPRLMRESTGTRLPAESQ
jgi:hypothetical protein